MVRYLWHPAFAILHFLTYPLLKPVLSRLYIIKDKNDYKQAQRAYWFLKGLQHAAWNTSKFNTLLEFGLPFLSQHPKWKDVLKGFRQKPIKPGLPEFSKVEALEKLLDIFNQHDIRGFLCFGSLLGMVRDGRFLSHDSDIDIGLFYDECDVKRIHQIFITHGYRVSAIKKDPWPCKLQVIDPKTSVFCDLIFFKREANCFKTFTMYGKHVLIRERKSFELEERSFYHLKVWVPENPEAFLTENYGDWKNPAVYYHFILSSELTDYTNPLVQYLFVTTCIDLIIWNRHAAANTLITRWNQEFPEQSMPLLY